MKRLPKDVTIRQAASTRFSIWYRINEQITVTTSKNDKNEWVFRCLTCVSTDACPHTQAVREFCNQPLRRQEVA